MPLVEDLLEKAEARAQRHGDLRDSLDPLRRLVRSYVRGSYRAADASDVAWALAAVMYVASPVDAVPDYLPGGLKDDEKVVQWVRRRLVDALAAYEEWEQSIGGAALPSGEALETEERIAASQFSLEVQVLEPVDPSLFHRVDGSAARPAAAITANPMVTGAVELQSALQAGQVVRVVGPAHVLQGLNNGTLEMIHSGAGNLGTVRDVTTKDFAGNLRFGDLQAQNAAAPALAAFQVASAVTLQYYLARIDRQLGAIDHEIRGARQDVRDERYGRIETARKRCVSAERVLAETGDLGVQDVQRLNLATHDLEQTYNALRASVEGFCERIENADMDTIEKAALERLLKDGSGVAFTDAQLLLFAAVVRHRIHAVQSFLSSREGATRAEIAVDELDNEHQEMVGLLSRTRDAFRSLHVPKRHLDERWGVLGGPERDLAEYSTTTAALRDRLATPQTALPPYVPEEPFVMDLRLGRDRGLEVEWAYLRPVSVSDEAARLIDG